jgi:hypothetical protein
MHPRVQGPGDKSQTVPIWQKFRVTFDAFDIENSFLVAFYPSIGAALTFSRKRLTLKNQYFGVLARELRKA